VLQRDAIATAFGSALGRAPEEAAFSRCQLAFKNVQDLVESLIASDEFKIRSWHQAASKVRSAVSKLRAPAWRNEPSDIEWAYRTILGREPENYAAIASWYTRQLSRGQVVEEFIRSEEFRSDAWHAAAFEIRSEYSNKKEVQEATRRGVAASV
jgi:hypothetical protein